ncbi:MAG: glycerate kinase [Dehalococcoidales bacterium]|nr:glycerate kinase [Dehalococcoidales bacterium]MDP7285928.1 glycerate kinase [Dehalococcoidales bacterium]MDP7415659.1 glycerate kinase [Dehalococcoidales bacterium]
MKIVIAPQGFKGNLTALQVARAIEEGIKRVVPDTQTTIKPMADGGEGTVQALVDATGGKMIATEVTGPLGKPVTAQWGILSDKVTAVIEMAAASGLPLVPPEKRDPLVTTTRGTGELVVAALDNGCRKLITGIGGSATNDGGAGMAQALGARLLDAKGKELPSGGTALAQLERIDISQMDSRLTDFKVTLASDVNNPLCGPNGASAIYGPQKGATETQVRQLDAALSHYADIIQRDLGIDLRDAPGAGAAGGLGLGLMVFLKARPIPGIDVIIKATDLMADLEGADLVFTAEGRIDCQSAMGKVPTGVALKAKEFGLPVIAIAGEVTDDCRIIYEQGIDAVVSIAPGPITLNQSMTEAEKLIGNAAECAMRVFVCRVKE